MSKLEELIKKLCPNGVEYKELSTLVDYIQPTKYIVRNTKYNDEYDIPVLTPGQTFILGYTNEKEGIYNADKENPIILFDDFTTAFRWINFKFKVKSSAVKILIPKNNNINFRYVFYTMQTIKFDNIQHNRQWISKYSTLKIPVPPIEIQKEIVRILDNFTELEAKLEAELEAELEARKKQYDYYLEKILGNTRTYEITVGEACDTVTDYVAAGSFADIARNVKYLDVPSYAQLVRTVDIKNNFRKSDYIYVDEKAFNYLWRVNLDKESIILPNIGVNCGEVYYVEPEKLIYRNNVLGPNAILLRSSNNNNKYLSYLFKTINFQKQLRKIISPAGQTKFNKTELKRLKIRIPSKEEQDKCVKKIEILDKLCNDISQGLPAEIEARRKQYEYYRDKLLNFKELKVENEE